ncbi:lactonase family protein [Paenibacillus sp. LHD-117]|uniref:lactonase family protein n=1 Tax=Paenibacillus sp. LHD-117 TaxID=3071412 RepID=UPI0027E0176C|nr:lactonase family protein [Paenibacillus sp. LHD-117]MDQ6418044.1 lactonase family protein [Paenibacillus sp. LHD-117]
MANQEGRLFVFVGSYAGDADHGVKVFRCNEVDGSLTLQYEYGGLSNPTFLNVDAARGRLYAIADKVNEHGKKVGEAVSFAIDRETGALTELNRAWTVDNTTCHIQRDEESRFLTVTSYHGGMIGLSEIEADGSIGGVIDVIQHTGRSSDEEPQDRPHPHSSFYSPDGRFLFVQDLGLDRIVAYRLDAEAGKLSKHNETVVHAGAGPRHFVFHPSGSFAYVINELDSTVTAFRYDGEQGLLTELETISTLPDSFEGENGCAEIAISRDGNYLYGSNRGHDSIVVYELDQDTGKLKTTQHISTEGGHPRHFALTPNGNYLIAANRDGNNLVTYRVSESDGTLAFTGLTAEASKPVCVIPVYLTS